MLVMTIENEKHKQAAYDKLVGYAKQSDYVAGTVIEVERGGSSLFEVRTIRQREPGPLKPAERRVHHFIQSGVSPTNQARQLERGD